jgi:hypothetical protein
VAGPHRPARRLTWTAGFLTKTLRVPYSFLVEEDRNSNLRLAEFWFQRQPRSFPGNKYGNFPTAYDEVPNAGEPDQEVLYVERQPDTVQTDHFDWGFRLTNLQCS